jgi:SAM-dependent methyltransferase
LPQVTTSEVIKLPGIDSIQDATNLDQTSNSLDAIVMTDVIHHIPDLRAFFREANRCLRIGGRVVAIEPWNTAWSSFIYRNFHHEPFLPHAPSWDLPKGGPLSIANGALPYICFERDRNLFEKDFPGLIIGRIRVLMPFSYLLSGGFSAPGFMPRWAYRPTRTFERLLCERKWGMFALVVLEKV